MFIIDRSCSVKQDAKNGILCFIILCVSSFYIYRSTDLSLHYNEYRLSERLKEIDRPTGAAAARMRRGLRCAVSEIYKLSISRVLYEGPRDQAQEKVTKKVGVYS